MKVIEGLAGLDELRLGRDQDDLAQHSVVSVGVFDGVHLGHQRLLHELLEMASELRGVPTVITFKNHPDALLQGSAPPPIVSVPHRLRLLRRCGVARTLLLTFDDELRRTTPESFARRVLVLGLRTRGLLLGYDSALGKDRAGTPARFRELGAQLGFVVREAAPFTVDGRAVSSTLIRTAIAAGDLDGAHRLLGRWPSAFGEVVRGEQRGRQIGFPTANVLPQSPVLPPHGVYAVQVLLGGDTHAGVANLGVRPTFGAGAPVLEVHLLDWQGDLYGQVLEVCFLTRLRPERKFASVEELREQIARDVASARDLLRT